MNPIFHIASAVCNRLEKGAPFVLATIVSHQGSTPRTAGTKMIVEQNGNIVGTIGGGLFEAKVMETAADLIAGGGSAFLPFDLTYDDVASMDMICGGAAEVLLDRIDPAAADRDVFTAWRQALDAAETCWFLTIIRTDGDAVRRIDHCLLKKDGTLLGAFPLPPSRRTEVADAARQSAVMTVLTLDDARIVIEPGLKPRAAYLFGGGHVARPAAHLAAMTGFRVTALDDRAAFASRERFPDAHDIRVLDDFENAFAGLTIDADAFVVIFTRGHLHDRTVLAQALRTDAGYIGMIGSKKKRDAIYNALLRTGFTQADIDRVHSPIGLSIGAETPQEIAVSIVAEMILERSRMR